MATFIATDVLTGAVEVTKYVEIANVTEIYTIALPTTIVSGDTIKGPTIPAGNYLVDVIVDVDDLDSNGSPTIAFEAGYTSHLGAFIATGNTTAQAGGVQHANVAGTVGFTATTDTQILVTLTASPATGQAGTMRIAAVYTASP